MAVREVCDAQGMRVCCQVLQNVEMTALFHRAQSRKMHRYLLHDAEVLFLSKGQHRLENLVIKVAEGFYCLKYKIVSCLKKGAILECLYSFLVASFCLGDLRLSAKWHCSLQFIKSLLM